MMFRKRLAALFGIDERPVRFLAGTIQVGNVLIPWSVWYTMSAV